MKHTAYNHTIVAISTPIGEGGISVVRLSGSRTVSIVNTVFSGKQKITTLESHRAVHGWIIEEAVPLDEVVVTLFRSPNSYTGEDVIEISCHGGLFLTQRMVELLLKKGARMAQPGEFSQRAVLNGKMDLSQAEAVADIIHAKTEAARRAAAYQLEGRLSKRVRCMRDKLIHACSLVELELDFTEEDIEFVSQKEMKKLFAETITEMDALLASFHRGQVCREGIRMAIVGRSNVGKSSILNGLLERERAIVTEIAGTTRDTIEDILDIEGILFIITDTAGLRETEDRIEREGVRRAEEAMERADLVLLVFDGSEPVQHDDEMLVRRFQNTDKRVLIVINKMDLEQKIQVSMLNEWFPKISGIRISALKQNGIRELVSVLKKTVLSEGFPGEGEAVLTRIRHKDCVFRAVKSLRKAQASLSRSMSQEFIALDLRESLDALGEILGEITTDDILKKIFSEFCIGK